MALPILDGNQTATTLSTILSSGAHIPAHTVVSLGSQAITDMRSAVSGSVVSISNLPTTQTIAGTVTANGGDFVGSQYGGLPTSLVAIAGYDNPNGELLPIPLYTSNDASTSIDEAVGVHIGHLPAISGTVTANVTSIPTIFSISNYGSLGTSNFITDNNGPQNDLGLGIAYNTDATDPGFAKIVSENYPLPISGTVTANVFGADIAGNTFQIPVEINSNGISDKFIPIGFNDDGDARQVNTNSPLPIQAPNGIAISGTVTANVNYEGALGGNLPEKLAVIAGYVSDDSEIRPLPLYTQQDFGQQNNRGVGVHVISSPNISGTVTASVTNSVTIGSLPRPTWTDYSGTIVTAGTSVTAISTTTRSYLLAQVTTGQMFINIGATATTLNSVYFSAGQGFAWETSVPQGIVSIISSVTGTNYVLKDG